MDFLQRLIYTALGAASLFYFFVKISQSHWKNRGILHEKPKFLWGNLKGVGSKHHICSVIRELYEKYKDKATFVGCYAYLKPMLLILDLNTVQHILLTDANYFMERGLYYNTKHDPLSANLVQLDGHQYQILSQKLRSVFTKQKIELIIPKLAQIANTFKCSLAAAINQQNRPIFVLKHLAECYNSDVVSSLAFGLDGDSLRHPYNEFCIMSSSYLKKFSIIEAYLTASYPNLARFLDFTVYNRDSTTYFQKLISTKLAERKSNRMPKQNDFLTFFEQLKSNSGEDEQFSDSDIAAQAFSFLLADLGACNSSLTFCLYELALHQDIQNKVRDEIELVMQRHKNNISAQSLSELQYLKQVLYETLRKYCPYPLLLRNTTEDYEVPNTIFMLKKDNFLVIPVSAIHHDPNIYPEPENFDPNRFHPDIIKRRHPMAWLPFGAGPRQCISRHFAELQLIMGLMTMIRHFKFSTCIETPTFLEYDNTKFILTPKSDIKLLVDPI